MLVDKVIKLFKFTNKNKYQDELNLITFTKFSHQAPSRKPSREKRKLGNSLIENNFSAKSALHHQAAPNRRGPVQGEGEGGRE